MSYGNQWDHEHLDRQEIKAFLLDMAAGRLDVSSSSKSRDEHLAGLKDACDSDLEKRWLGSFIAESACVFPPVPRSM